MCVRILLYCNVIAEQTENKEKYTFSPIAKKFLLPEVHILWDFILF